MRWLIGRLKNNNGFTLVEVIISMLILSIVASAALTAFVYSLRISKDNKYEMTSMNLANDRMEYIRSLPFAEIGTKTVEGATVIYGDPKGEILQSETKVVGGVAYTVNTTISWEDQSGWELGSVDWDYKSVRVEVNPQINGRENELKKVLDSLVTRDSSQPILAGSNIALRMVRGWKEDPLDIIIVPDIKVSLNAGPSAPRQVKTSSSGIARFIDLGVGTYNVNIVPSNIGMMLRPDELANWSMAITSGYTASKEFEVEYPCYLKINLKSLSGEAIELEPTGTGTISVDVPYGTDISKNITSADFASAGSLAQNFLGELWPVGIGYSGVYSITDLTLPNSTYFGAYENNGSGEILWTGTFDAPNTIKELTCYFGTIPKTSSEVNANWAKTNGRIVTGSSPYTANYAVFSTSNTQQSIVMQAGTISDFDANGIYFENTGNLTNPGLVINNQSSLNLHAGIVVFRGKVLIDSAADATDRGKITLSTVLTDGSLTHSVPGTAIGGLANISKMYGKVYFVQPMVLEGGDIINPGGYYFYDGQILPDNVSELIPITKDNYVN